MKASKKLLSLLLVVMLLVSAIPFQVFAAEVNVPVTVVEEDGTSLGINRTLSVPDEGVTLDRALGDSLLGASSEYETVCWRSAATNNNLPLTETLTNATASAKGYSIKLVVQRKEVVPTNPTTYTATLKATLDGHEVGSATRTGITSIDLTENLAKSLYTGFDASRHEFKGWSGGLSGTQNLTADATFTAEFETIPAPTPAPTYTATLKATLDGHEVGSATRTGITSIDLTEELAESLYTGFDAEEHEFKGWAGGLSGTQNLTADATFTAVFETIPAPTYSVTVNVYYNNRFKTTQVLTEKTSVTLNNALLKDVYADFDASEETAQWYRGAVGSTAIATGTTETLSANATYSVNITPIVDVKYHNIKVYAVKYVGNGTTFVNQGVVSTPIFDSGNIEGTVNVLDYLESTENWGVIETNANKIGKIRTNPTFYTDSALTTRLKNETLTDASKVVYVRVDVEEVKNVLLYVHKGSSITNLTNLDPKVLHGYEVGDYVEYADVQKILGSNVKFYGLFTEERWGNLNASIKDDQLPKIRVPAGGVEIHVWVYSGNVSNADSSNPKTGDYILTTAVSLMVISGLAAAAVYVVGKKRRV